MLRRSARCDPRLPERDPRVTVSSARGNDPIAPIPGARHPGRRRAVAADCARRRRRRRPGLRRSPPRRRSRRRRRPAAKPRAGRKRRRRPDPARRADDAAAGARAQSAPGPGRDPPPRGRGGRPPAADRRRDGLPARRDDRHPPLRRPTPGSPTTGAGRGSARSGSTSASGCSAGPSPSGEVGVTGDYPTDPSLRPLPRTPTASSATSRSSRSSSRRWSAAAGRSGRWARSRAEPDAFDDAGHRARPGARRPRRRGDGQRRPHRAARPARGPTSSGAPDAEQALREIGGQIIGLRHPGEVLQRSVDEAARLLDADGARIDILDEATAASTGRTTRRPAGGPASGPIAGSGEAKAGEGISGKAVREMRPIFTGDYLNDDRFEHAAAPRRPRPPLPDPVGRRGAR